MAHARMGAPLAAIALWLLAAADAALAQTSSAGSAERVTAFLKRYCIRCHGSEKQKGKVAFHLLGDQPKPGAEIQLWKRMLKQLESGAMPPEKAAQPSPDQRKQAIMGIVAALEKAGHRREGNEIAHETLFLPRGTARTETEARLWRLTGPAYENFFRERFRGYKTAYRVRSPWEMVPDKEQGFSDFSSFHRVGEAELEHHIRNVIPIVREGLSRRPLTELKTLLKSGESTTAPQAAEAVGALFVRVLRREPSVEERGRYAGFLLKNLKQKATPQAVEQVVLAVLLHPEALYRVEVPGGTKGRAILPPHHLARAIAYGLTDEGPDEALLKAATEGKLSRREEILVQVIRILDDPKIAKPRILRFFQEYFGYTKAPDVFKDTPTLQAAGIVGRRRTEWDDSTFQFVADADRLVEHILESDRNVLVELLTTRETFALNGPEARRKGVPIYEKRERGFFWAKRLPLALKIYEIEEISLRRDTWSPDRPYAMPDGHRMGILTHPSWLVAHSQNFNNDAIRRGKWIRERLLGLKVPDVPVTVDAKLPDEPNNTLRHRMRVTREAYCWKCHRHMDPLGLPFEKYDHFGRYRETERGKPAVATGELKGTGDPKLDGPVKDPRDLIRRLASSKRVEQVFVRHVFRYFVGRNETAEDGPALVEAHRAYVGSGGSMKALVASILTSEAFLYRVAVNETGRRER